MSQKTMNITKNNLLKACSGAFLTVALLCGTAGSASAQVLVKNNGAIFSIKSGAEVIVVAGTLTDGSVENDGLVDNAGTLIVEGDFINQDTANGGGTTGRYDVRGDWENNGSFQADQSEVVLYGTNQLVTGSNNTTFYNLSLTGTGVKTLDLDATVTNVLDLNDRELATDVNTMFVTNTATGAIDRTTGYVSSLGAGRLSRELAASAAYLFPTGSSAGVTRYRPLVVTPTTANAQTIEARLANVNATTEGFNINTREAEICEINPDFFHLIGHTAGSTDDVSLSLSFNPGVDGVYKDIAHWQNVPQWELIDPITAGVAGGLSTLTVSGWNVFSPEAFALANENPSLDDLATDITPVSCFGLSDGAIDVTVANGTDLVYTYSPALGAGPDLNNIPAGTYTLSVTDTATGCNRGGVLDTFVVTQPLQIGIAALVTDVLCFGLQNGEIDLTITNAGGGVSSITYNGTQGSANEDNLAANQYVVIVTDNNGCAEDTVLSITQPDEIVITPTITNISCNGLETGSIQLDVVGGVPGYNFTWSTPAIDTTQNLTGLPAGTYAVTVTDVNKCPDSLINLVVTEPDPFTLVASNDTTIPFEFSTDLEVLSTSGGTGSVTYEWTPGETLSDPNAASTTATPTETTSYIVTGTDDNGCIALDTVLVTVDFNLVAIPDAFSPNGAPANRVFTVHHSDAIELVEMKIFNRWGQLIHEGNNWDGTYKSTKQPMDTYIYQVVFNLPDGTTANYSGDFILIR